MSNPDRQQNSVSDAPGQSVPTARYRSVGKTVAAEPPSVTPPPRTMPSSVQPERLRHIAATIRHLAMQRDLLGLGAIAAQAAAELVGAERARCLFYDADAQSMWTESRVHEPDQEFSANDGLAGFAARTGTPRLTSRAHTDPVYRREVDDPSGTGSERLLAFPIRMPTGETHAVVVLARHAQQHPFDAADLELCEVWAHHAAPLFHMYELEAIADAAVEYQTQAGLFRAEAVQAYRAGAAEQGDPLRTAPAWTRWAYWLVMVCITTAFAYLCLAKMSEYAVGPAIVVSSGHRDVTTTAAGVLQAIDVAPGQPVKKGIVVARLGSEVEQADFERVQRDYERELIARLRSPADRNVEQSVARLRVELERAKTRLEATMLRAPSDGIVGDIRLGQGQAVAPGQTVLTLITDDGRPRIRAFVPGQHRPGLEVDEKLILDLDGFAHASQYLRVSAVGSEVLGPAEMRRMVGPQLADAITVGGAVVMVEAPLPDSTFEADGRTWTIHDGMTGRAEIEVRRESLLFVLFPRLKDLLTDD